MKVAELEEQYLSTFVPKLFDEYPGYTYDEIWEHVLYQDLRSRYLNLIGTDGPDDLAGGRRADTLDGGAGNDSLNGGHWPDLLIGGTGDDLLIGGDGMDTLQGGDGDDTLDGSGGADGEEAHGGNGNDLVIANLSAGQFLSGGQGRDTLDATGLSHGPVFYLDWDLRDWSDLPSETPSAFFGFEEVWLGTGDDVVHSNRQRATGVQVNAGAGDDDIAGAKGADRLFGQAGNDYLNGRDGNNLIHGGAGDDYLISDRGHSTLIGGSGDDTIYGGSGRDILDGGGGDDTIFALGGRDTVTTGSGKDVVEISGGSKTKFITDFNPKHDKIRLLDVTTADGTAVTGINQLDTNGDGNITGADLHWRQVANDLRFDGPIYTWVRDDSSGAVSRSHNDIVFEGLSQIPTAAFDWTKRLGTGEADRLIGTDADEYFDGRAGEDSLHAGAGDDTLYGDQGADLIRGERGDDILRGGDGADTLKGGPGNDTLHSGGTDDFGHNPERPGTKTSATDTFDWLDGGAGDDLLRTDNARAVLTGGRGDDTFEFHVSHNSGSIQITDFEDGRDRLSFVGLPEIEFSQYRNRDDFDTNADGKITEADAYWSLTDGNLQLLGLFGLDLTLDGITEILVQDLSIGI